MDHRHHDVGEGNGRRPKAVFVTWAHGGEAWEEAIAGFVFKLRELGIEADVDLFHLNEPSVNWATYGPSAAKRSDFVLIAASAAYKERWEETGDPRTGAGAAREANVLKALFNDDRKQFYEKVKIVILPGATTADIPDELRAAVQRFEVKASDFEGLMDLVRTLTGQAAYVPQPVGIVPILPQKLVPEVSTGVTGATKDSSVELADLRTRLEELEGRLAVPSRDDVHSKRALSAERATLKAAVQAITSSAARRSEGDAEFALVPESVHPLVEALDDPDGMVRFNAMTALGNHLDPGLLPVIEPLLKDRDEYIRRYAVEYYARLDPPDCVQRLVEALDDVDGMVRFNAMTALGNHLDPGLLPVIEPLLKDRDEYIRRYAVEYYARLGA